MSETTQQIPAVHRRSFLQGALAIGAGAALGPFGALGQRMAGAVPGGRGVNDDAAGYGPLLPAKDQTTGLELLLLPRGFEYMSFGWTNDPMSDGTRTPGSHDGMGAFRVGDRVHLVRNHERGAGTPFGPPALSYNAAAGWRHDDSRLRSRCRQAHRQLAQRGRHHPKLCRRAHAGGHVADV